MCGRYYIDSDMVDEIEKVVHDIDQRIRQEHFAGDIFPTNVAPIIEKSEHGLKLDVCKWGYPLSQGKNLVINARAESVMDKPSFRNGIRYHRILIPASRCSFNGIEKRFLCYSSIRQGFYKIIEKREIGYEEFILSDMSNRMRKELDGFSTKIHGEQISDFPCYLIGQLSKNSNIKSEEISRKQLIDFASDIILMK